MIRSRKTRSGFTLVELMISAAITVMIMTILSICFQVSMKAMSAMRAQGDAADQLRAVGEVIKRDVNASHFLPVDPGTGPRNLGRRLSDYDPSYSTNPIPRTGFFFIDAPAGIAESSDNVFDSSRNAGVPGVGCSLWMTCILPGGSEGNLFTTTVSPTTVSSEAAEVAYFLSSMNENTAGPGGIPRFNLHRRQRLVAVDGAKQSAMPNDPQVISMFSSVPGPPNTVHTMSSIANAARRSELRVPLTAPRQGDDIILSNVISFEIKPTWRHPTAGRNPRGFALGSNTDTPFDNLTVATGGAGFTFDTLGGSTQQYRITGMQLRIRIYDPKAKTARQSTFVLDL